MKQKPGYNYHGKPRGARMAHDYEIDNLRITPTAKQRKFLWFLTKTLESHNVDIPPHPYPIYTRGDYASRIDSLVRLCNENEIPIRNDGKKFDRVIEVHEDGTVRERLAERKEESDAT